MRYMLDINTQSLLYCYLVYYYYKKGNSWIQLFAAVAAEPLGPSATGIVPIKPITRTAANSKQNTSVFL